MIVADQDFLSRGGGVVGGGAAVGTTMGESVCPRKKLIGFLIAICESSSIPLTRNEMIPAGGVACIQ